MRKSLSTMVFVDDFVRGELPPVCVVTGQPTTDQAKLRSQRQSPLWLIFLFFPPLGWLVLLGILTFARHEELVGWLPLSEEAYRARKKRYRQIRIGMLTAAGVFLLAVLVLTDAALGGVVGIMALGAIVVGALAAIWFKSGEPAISLDASRRWVTIQNVHPEFATAAEPRLRPPLESERTL